MQCHARGSRKETKIQEFMYRDVTNLEPEMYEYICNNWSHQNSNIRFKIKSGSYTRKIFNRFKTKDIPAWNITHNMEGTAVFGKYVYFI